MELNGGILPQARPRLARPEIHQRRPLVGIFQRQGIEVFGIAGLCAWRAYVFDHDRLYADKKSFHS
jgi:hypothetical protein